jgi:guanylate kinase
MSSLFVVAGPSGVGKGTVVRRLLAQQPGVWLSVSATTRAPRPDERDGVEYWFLTPDEFARREAAGEFLEAFGHFEARYGTPRGPVEDHLAAGDDVILEIDVQGAMRVRDVFPGAVLVFLRPPDRDAQRARLVGRDGVTDPEAIERRLARADEEEAMAESFDVVLVNDDLDRVVTELAGIVEGRRTREP